MELIAIAREREIESLTVPTIAPGNGEQLTNGQYQRSEGDTIEVHKVQYELSTRRHIDNAHGKAQCGKSSSQCPTGSSTLSELVAHNAQYAGSHADSAANA